MRRKKAGSSKAAVKLARKVQQAVDERDRGRSKPAPKAMQAGPRNYPKTFPAQHLRKPGIEAELEFAPMFEGRGYSGSGKLKGMVALITKAWLRS